MRPPNRSNAQARVSRALALMAVLGLGSVAGTGPPFSRQMDHLVVE